MTVHSAEGKAATDIIQANIDRYKLLADDRNRSEEAGNGNTLEDAAEKIQSHWRPPASGWPRDCGGRESSLSGR